MMTNEQYLLGKLAEEAAGLAQIAIKAQQFGMREVFGAQNKDAELSNMQRIQSEYNDVIGVVRLLNQECDAGIEIAPADIAAKCAKVEKWRAYARFLSMVE